MKSGGVASWNERYSNLNYIDFGAQQLDVKS